MSCGNCDCCPKCGCKATCTCENSFSEGASDMRSFMTVAGETGKCGNNCSCPPGTCANDKAGESVASAGDTGKCGNCSCPPGTCANNKD